MTLSMDPEVKKLRRQVETFKEGWRIADEGRIEAEAEVDRLTAERDALRAALAKARAEGLREAAKIAEDTWHDPEAEAHPNYQAKAILAAADRIEAEANNSTAHQKTAL